MEAQSSNPEFWKHFENEMAGTALESDQEVTPVRLFVPRVPVIGADIMMAFGDPINGLMENRAEFLRAMDFLHLLDAHDADRDVIAALPIEPYMDGFIIDLQFPSSGSDEAYV